MAATPFAGAQVFTEHYVQPEVWHFAGPVDAGVTAGGDLSFSIPVLTVPGRGLDFDVAFSYQSGIRVQQRASWIGLGWSFDPGSVVRDVHGGVKHPNTGRWNEVDFPATDGDGDHYSDEDYQPDAYYVHLPSGTYPMVQAQGESHPAPTPTFGNPQGFYMEEWHTWRIKATATGPVTVAGETTNERGTNHEDYSRFEITTDEGTRYVFEEPTLARWHGRTGSSTYVNVWRLRAILAADYTGPDIPTDAEAGSWVRFDYEYNDSTPEPAKLLTQGQGSMSTLLQATYLSRITTPTHYADFVTEARSDVDMQYAQYNQDRFFYRNLTQIELWTRGGSAPIKTIELAQDQSLAWTTASSIHDGFGDGAGKTTLNEIRFKDSNGVEEPGYAFDYPDSGTAQNPRDPFQQYNPAFAEYNHLFYRWLRLDDYGFYNAFDLADVGSNEWMSGLVDTENDDGEAWSLTGITYPTGGAAEFNYENDEVADNQIQYDFFLDHSEARDAGCPVSDCPDVSRTQSYFFESIHTPRKSQGGARIASITRTDGMGNVSTETFEYGSGRTTGLPGKRVEKDNAVYQSSEIFEYPQNRNVNYPSPVDRGTARVVYETIDRVSEDGSFTRTHYTTSSNHSSVDRQQTIAYQYAGWGWNGLTACLGNQAWNWGREFKREHFNSSGDLVHVSDQTLLFSHAQAPLATAGFFQGQQAPNNTLVYAYVKHGRARLDRVTEKRGGTTLSTTYYEYDDQTNLIKEERQSRYKPDSPAHVRKKTRAFAFRQAGYYNMRERNMLRQVAQETVSETAGGTTRYYSSQATTWRKPPGRSFWKPYRTYGWKADEPSISLPSFSWSGTPSSAWQLASTNDQYDEHGNVTRILDAAGRATDLSYDSSAPYYSAYLTGVSKGSLSASMTYDTRFRGLESVTDENGDTRSYEYDAMGRLTGVVNAGGQDILSHSYEYAAVGSDGDINEPNYVRTTAHGGDSPDAVTTTYFDGLARLIQTHQRIGSRDVIAAVEYDTQGRLWKRWRPYDRSNSSHVFRSNFDGEATSYYSGTVANVSGRPFSETQYADDPLARRDLVLDAGESASHRSTRYSYSAGSYRDGASSLAYTRTLDADGRDVERYTDSFGDLVAERRTIEIDPLSIDPISISDYTLGPGQSISEQRSFTVSDARTVEWWTGEGIGRAAARREDDDPPAPCTNVEQTFRVFEDGTVIEEESSDADNEMSGQFVAQAGRSYVAELEVENLCSGGDPLAGDLGAEFYGIAETLVITEFIRDGAGRVTGVRSPNYFDLARPQAEREGFETTYTYNTLGELVEEESPDAGRVRYKYNREGLLRFSQDENQRAEGVVAYRTYDEFGRITLFGLGHPLSCESDPEGCWDTLDSGQRVPDAKDPTCTLDDGTICHWEWRGDNRRTQYLYDDASQTNGDGAVRVETWPFYGDPDFAYENTRGRPVAVAHRTAGLWISGGGEWQRTFFSYDAEGNVTSRWVRTSGAAPEWEKFEYEYDRQGRVTEERIGVGSNYVNYFYDYDERGLLEEVRAATGEFAPRPALADVAYEYDAAGNIESVQIREESGDVYALEMPHEYDVQGRLHAIGDITPSGNAAPFSARYAYTAAGLIKEIDTLSPYAATDCEADYGTEADACSPRWFYLLGYDELARLRGAYYYAVPDQGEPPHAQDYDLNGITYDLNGNVLDLVRWGPTEADPEGQWIDELHYTYAPGTNRLESVTDGTNGWPESHPDDQRPALDWDAKPTTFTYDGNGNVKQLRQTWWDDTHRTTYTSEYDESNLPLRVQLPDNITARYRYNTEGQRIWKSTTYTPPPCKPAPCEVARGTYSVERYVRDGARLVGVFDGEGNLLRWNLPGLAGRLVPAEPDVAVMRAQAEQHADSALVNDTDAILEAALFAAGVPKGDVAAVVAAAAYDVEQVMTGAVPAAVAAAEDDGALRADAGGSEFYTLTASDLTVEIERALVAEGFAQGNAEDYAKVAGAEAASAGAAELQAAVEAASVVDGEWGPPMDRRYYVADHLGSVRAVVDEDGTVVEARDFYPFGLEMPGRTWMQGEGTAEGYTGHELDAETGMYYAGARYYMPALGRWTSVDPLAGKNYADSPYAYVTNNPFSFTDPLGADTTQSIGEDGIAVLTIDEEDGPTVFGERMDDEEADGDAPMMYESGEDSGGSMAGVGVLGPLVPIALAEPTPVGEALLGLAATGILVYQVYDLLNNPVLHSKGDIKKLNDYEIGLLDDAGYDAEELKGGTRTGNKDLFKHKDGEIRIHPKDGSGPGEPTGLNIKDFL